MKVFTIGFTKKPAESFFPKLKKAGVKRVIDIRLNNVSQLAGFTKRDDLRYFLHEICGIEYVHLPELAPTKEVLQDYQKKKIDWTEYEHRFFGLMTNREVERIVDKQLIDEGCLLCSEERPDHCHRRLVAEYLRDKWGDIEIIHIL